MDAIIQVNNLTRRFGETLAVDRLRFEVERGEIFGFLGPNGAGKTTTVRMLTGYLPPTEGTAVIDGHDVVREPNEARLHFLNKELLSTSSIVSAAEGLPADRFARKVLSKVEATCEDVTSALVGALHGMATAAGMDWSVARVNSLLGYSFHFCIKPEGAYTEHQSVIEWALFFDVLDRLGFQTRHFEAYLAEDGRSSDGTPIPQTPAEEESTLREATWHAVCASIDRGIPAIAWSPMTVAQMEEGVGGHEWGLLVGYDEKERTYTVHHRSHSNKPYTVPFDGFGHCDGQEWYYVMTFGDHTPPDEPGLVAAALNDAVAYANGTRYQKDACCYPVAGVGFEAYEVWRDALARGLPDTNSIDVNAKQLKINRQHAAIFLRESAQRLGGPAAQALSDAAACYDMEVAAVAEVRDISRAADKGGEFTAAHQREAVANVGAALEADRLAIGHIESALGLLA